VKSQDIEQIWVRAARVPKMADIGLTKTYELINSGRLVSRKEGGMRLVSIASIKALGGDKEPEAT
jgi:hypothetical protein